MDIFHKINPFSRPPTRMSSRDRPSLDISARPSSSLDSTLPPLPESPNVDSDEQDRLRSFTPHHFRQHSATPLTPHTPKSGHTRTPSLLRSLAHHPSLSALRSKSKSSRKKRKSVAKAGFAELGSGSSDDLANQGVRRKLSKRGLKGSRSVPKDLRSKEDFDPYRRIPPLPSPTLAMAHASRYRDRPTPTDPHHTSLSQRPVFSRADSATPSIVVQHHDLGTPESVKIRRMKFEIEIESPGKRRARSASTSVGDAPSKMNSASSRRHLSSPAPPGRSRSSSTSNAGTTRQQSTASYPHVSLPTTTQHPHPVPLDVTRSPTPGSISSYYLGPHAGRDGDDFVPVSESDAWLEDGLDVMVPQQELPTGTPGGKRADLRLGAFVDGARREKDAIRFFSRDMYSSVGLTSTPLAMHASSRQTSSSTFSTSNGGDQEKIERKKATHARRSSSPFEVKLTPTVSKRVSLDAFGGTAAPVDGRSSGYEEVLDDIPSIGEEDSSFDRPDVEQGAGSSEGGVGPLATFHATTLSTINEVSSGDQIQDHLDTGHPNDILPSRYYTPDASSQRIEVYQDPPSPFIPPRQHFSAPPLSTTRSLLEAHENHATALDDELRASMTVISELQAEARRLQDAFEEESDEKRKVLLDIAQVQRELLQAETALRHKETVIQQLRKAVDENEDWFDQMHFELDEALQRAATLESDKESMLAFNEVQHGHLVKIDTELRELQAHTDELVKEKEKSQEAIHELQTSLAAAEAQLDATVEEYTTLLSSHESDLADARKVAFEKESLLLIKTEEHRLQSDKVGKLEGELKTTNLILASKEGEIARLQDKVGSLRFESNEKMFEAATQLRDLKREVEEKEAECVEMEDELRVLREDRDRGDRDRGELLHVIQELKEVEEGVPQLKETIAELESKLSTAEYRVQSLEAELADQSTLLENRALLSTSQGGQIAQLQRRLADAQDAHATLREDTIRRQREQSANIQQLQAECHELREQNESLGSDYEAALIRAETEKAKSEDVSSRLDSFAVELDRAALSETNLREEVAALRKKSATDEIARVELEKQVARLENDKELLNVALESKQTELALATRKSARAAGTTTPTTARTSSTRTLVSSTSRPSRSGLDETPIPARHLTSSTSSTSAMRASRRESSIIAPSPMPTPRPTKPRPLGQSDFHNRTPEKQKSSATTAKIVISTSTIRAQASTQRAVQSTPTGQPAVVRRSSLPVLRKQPSFAADRGKVSDLVEEDEDDLFA